MSAPSVGYSLGLPATSVLAAIDIQRFAGDEAGTLQIEHGIDDFAHLTQAADRMQGAEELMRFRRMHRRPDDTGRHRIHANAALGIFDRKPAGYGVETALRQRRKARGNAGDRLIHEGRRNLNDVTMALLQHLGNGKLRDMEEAEWTLKNAWILAEDSCRPVAVLLTKDVMGTRS